MSATDFSAARRADPADHIPFSLQVLSLLFFGSFAIVAVALAFAYFWPAGVLLAVILSWRGGFLPRPARRESLADVISELGEVGSKLASRSSGNASFDAYRADTLKRLEEEQESFETFLDRLRAAKDKREFDGFMDDRARAARGAESEPPAA